MLLVKIDDSIDNRRQRTTKTICGMIATQNWVPFPNHMDVLSYMTIFFKEAVNSLATLNTYMDYQK